MTGLLQKILLIAVLVQGTLFSSAQTNANIKKINNQLIESQKNFTRLLLKTNMDNNGKSILLRFITLETDSLRKLTNNSKTLSIEHKLLALGAQNNFFDTLQAEISNKYFDVNYTRLYIDRFKQLWQTIFTLRPYEEVMKPFKAKGAGMMAGVFRDYPMAAKINDIAILKKLEAAPDKITNFLSNHSNYSLTDSLIFISGNTQPELLINFALGTKDEMLSNAIRQHESPIIQTLLSIAKEKDLKTYIPFVLQLSEKQLTLADIDKTRSQPMLYYQLLVDAEISNRNKIKDGEVPLYAEPTKKYLKHSAIKFYINIINSLHDEPSENKRYFSLEGLRPQDLYYIITAGETELYTSSYLYIYKKLMGMLPNNGSDSLFRLVNYDQYTQFLLMAGRYNTLSSFMKQMPEDSSIIIIKKMMKGLDGNLTNGLEETVNIAETFPGIVNDERLSEITTREIRNNYTRCSKIPNPYGMKLYILLEEIFNAVKTGDLESIEHINPALSVYFKLRYNDITAGKNSVNQLVFFYGDEDGRSSYTSFLSNFTDGSKWSIEKTNLWVTIKSKSEYPVSIYANLPLTEDGEADIKAQEALLNHLAAKHIEPNIFIHRGHSYHLPNSLSHITPSIRLAILGSCGGYTEIAEVLKMNPEIQVISSKQVGSKMINEPLLKLVNEQLLNQKDLDWAVIWDKLDSQFKNNKQAYEYFKEYVPPYKNISLLVSALFTQSGIE